jgi:hypothetical protein
MSPQGPAATPSIEERTNQSSPGLSDYGSVLRNEFFASISGSRATFNLADHVVHSVYKIPLPFGPLGRDVDCRLLPSLLLKPHGAVLDLRERFDRSGTLFIAPNEDLLVERSSWGGHAACVIRFRTPASRVSQHALHRRDETRGIVAISAWAPTGRKSQERPADAL